MYIARHKAYGGGSWMAVDWATCPEEAAQGFLISAMLPDRRMILVEDMDSDPDNEIAVEIIRHSLSRSDNGEVTITYKIKKVEE